MFRCSAYLCLMLLTLTVGAGAADPEGSTPISKLTFNKDIAPIIFRNCTSCHRRGEAAPFPLTNYLDVKQRGRLIATVTASRYMPPWHAAPADVEYRDERRLSDAQIASIKSWVEQSMPEGDAGDLPPLPTFPQGWRLGEPDLILEMTENYEIPADGPDIYRNFAIPVEIPEDKWVRAIEYRPRARQSSHHAVFIIDSSGQALEAQKADTTAGFEGFSIFYQFQEWGSRDFFLSGGAGGGNSMGGWGVGGAPRVLPDGLAYKLPKGNTFVIQAHFHPSGKPEVEKARVGLHFADRPPERSLSGILLPAAFGRYAGLRIPPGDKDYTLRASFTTPVDIEAYGAGGHAHYLAKSMEMTATLPDGVSKRLLQIDHWDFDWQDRYIFRKPLSLPAGTRLDVVIKYDNSAENPSNPRNPPRRVQWGVRSVDEMGGMSIEVVPRREEDLSRLEEAKVAAVREGNSQTHSSITEADANQRLLERYDKDGDGSLSREEKKALFEDLMRRRKKTSEAADKEQ